jgi:hypothetical protein
MPALCTSYGKHRNTAMAQFQRWLWPYKKPWSKPPQRKPIATVKLLEYNHTSLTAETVERPIYSSAHIRLPFDHNMLCLSKRVLLLPIGYWTRHLASCSDCHTALSRSMNGHLGRVNLHRGGVEPRTKYGEHSLCKLVCEGAQVLPSVACIPKWHLPLIHV